MVDISRETCRRNGLETIKDNDRILWFNEKHREEGLDYKHSRDITINHHSGHKKHRYELATEPKKEYNRIFTGKKLAVQAVVDSRTRSVHKCRTRLGFLQYNLILTKEQSVITGIVRSFEGENMQTQYNLLGYRIDLYFHDYKRAIEIDEYGWNDRSIGYEIERQKQQNKNLVLSLLELILTKKNLILLELSMKYLNTLNNQLK